jgi:hypothetical protein
MWTIRETHADGTTTDYGLYADCDMAEMNVTLMNDLDEFAGRVPSCDAVEV